jgi:hypothetical protein|tara:strand:+ start:1014 stop:1238 length:225 start_codon:yes stop_codon:yes gene_type:complete
MSLEKDLQSLGNHEHFARFLKVVSELREETIEELHNASNEQIQQISGRILTYDQILQMCDWRNLQVRFADRLDK